MLIDFIKNIVETWQISIEINTLKMEKRRLRLSKLIVEYYKVTHFV